MAQLNTEYWGWKLDIFGVHYVTRKYEINAAVDFDITDISSIPA